MGSLPTVSHEALDGLGVDVDLPLVVDDAAPPEAAVADGSARTAARSTRPAGRPAARRGGRRRAAWACRAPQPLGEDGGMAGGRPDLDAPGAERAQAARRGARRCARTSRGVLRVARDRGDLHPLDELVDEALAVRVDERDDVLHGRGQT